MNHIVNKLPSLKRVFIFISALSLPIIGSRIFKLSDDYIVSFSIISLIGMSLAIRKEEFLILPNKANLFKFTKNESWSLELLKSSFDFWAVISSLLYLACVIPLTSSFLFYTDKEFQNLLTINKFLVAGGVVSIYGIGMLIVAMWSEALINKHIDRVVAKSPELQKLLQENETKSKEKKTEWALLSEYKRSPEKFLLTHFKVVNERFLLSYEEKAKLDESFIPKSLVKDSLEHKQVINLLRKNKK